LRNGMLLQLLNTAISDTYGTPRIGMALALSFSAMQRNFHEPALPYCAGGEW